MRDIDFGTDDLDKHFQREISSYYSSIKDVILDQYGQICDIDYIETNACVFRLDTTYDACDVKVFGGDTFINRFAIKRKMPFFQHTMCNMPDGSDVLYNKLFNVAEPKYWYNTPQPLFERISDIGIGLGLLNSIFSDNQHHPDVSGNGNIRFYRDGYVHLFNYGIPYFLVESDINVDYRVGQDNKGKGFYPHNSDLKDWLEEGHTPISTDNTFFYNRTYSKQDKESVIYKDCILNYNSFICQPPKRNRLIYSAQDNLDGYNDNWLVFKANDYYDFDLSLGRLISADGVEDDKILARLEKGSKLFPAYNTIMATEGNIQVGTGGMFKTRPQDIAVTKLGYGGTQNRALLNTEFGHIWADASGGQVFSLNLGSGVKEITMEKQRNWFKENLPFNIRKQFPSIDLDDIDNNFWGIGLHYCFDKRFSRILVTKLDYESIDPNVVYDKPTKRFVLPDTSPETLYKCPIGYTLINGTCKKIVSSPATKVSDLPAMLVTKKPYYSYGISGTAVYSSFNANGTGVYTMIDPANLFWKNNYDTNNLTIDGPLNRCAFWGSNGDDPINTWVGITFPVDVPVAKTYYIGVGADNRARIRIGCDAIMTFDEDAMAAQAGTDVQITFKRWHIYPVTLQKGINYITLEGFNVGQEGAFGAEIYDNTFEELNVAHSYGDINTLFSTRSLYGKMTDSFNYTCPDCLVPSFVDGQYVCQSESDVDPIAYLKYNPTEVHLDDTRYFCNKSWTTSYSFLNKNWVSYHSYKPNFYVEHVDWFDSSFKRLGNQSLYSHNLSNKSYQVFYGRLEAFIVEVNAKQNLNNGYLQSFGFNLDAIRYHNNYDEFYNQYKTFNKAIVYNNTQTSGLLNLIVSNPDDGTQTDIYPSLGDNGYNILVTNSESMWRFNDFFDISANQKNNIPLFINDCSNTVNHLNPKALKYSKAELDKARIRSRMYKVRLINDVDSQHHFIFNFSLTDMQTSIR